MAGGERSGRRCTTLAKLLAQKQQLLERLQEDAGPNEREKIQRLLAKIDEELILVEEAGPGISDERPPRRMGRIGRRMIIGMLLIAALAIVWNVLGH